MGVFVHFRNRKRRWSDSALLGRRHYLLEMRWTGQIPAQQDTITCIDGGVHRFKIDEEQKTVIATFSIGGLMVASIEDDALLWNLRNVRC